MNCMGKMRWYSVLFFVGFTYRTNPGRNWKCVSWMSSGDTWWVYFKYLQITYEHFKQFAIVEWPQGVDLNLRSGCSYLPKFGIYIWGMHLRIYISFIVVQQRCFRKTKLIQSHITYYILKLCGILLIFQNNCYGMAIKLAIYVPNRNHLFSKWNIVRNRYKCILNVNKFASTSVILLGRTKF